MEYRKVTAGILTLLIAASIVYVTFNDQARLRVDEDKTTFYLKTDDGWRVQGREYNDLFDGTTLLYRDKSTIRVWTEERDDRWHVYRQTGYQRGPVIIDHYVFDPRDDRIDQFPVSHEVLIINGTGHIYQYEVRDTPYEGQTIKNVGSPLDLGNNMLVSWDENSYWNTVYRSGVFKARWRITNDSYVVLVRLFDPPKEEAKLYDECVNESHQVIDRIPVFRNVTHPNGTVELRVDEWENKNRTVVVKRCSQKLVLKDKHKDIGLLGYVCTQDVPYIYCDSKVDGNGDGVCDARGGESCCRIHKGNAQVECKNGRQDWHDNSLPVRRIEG